MSNRLRFLKILSITWIVVLTTLGCASNISRDEVGGTFTLTGIPSMFNGMYALLEGYDELIWQFGAERIIFGAETHTFIASRISNGRVRLPMWVIKDDSVERFSGNNITDISIYIFNSAIIIDDNYWDENEIAVIDFDYVRFSNGNARKSWRQGWPDITM